jgi:hypothetical protein
MIIDKNGIILTDTELMKMNIKNTVINTDATNTLIKHLEGLVKNLECTEEYEKFNREYNYYLEEIRNYLSDNKKELAVKIDDCYTEILILFKEYFYKQGYYDCLKSRNI